MTHLEKLQKLVKFWTKQNAERQRAAAASQVEFDKWTAELTKAQAAAEEVASKAMINFDDNHSTLAEIGDEQINNYEKVPC